MFVGYNSLWCFEDGLDALLLCLQRCWKAWCCCEGSRDDLNWTGYRLRLGRFAPWFLYAAQYINEAVGMAQFAETVLDTSFIPSRGLMSWKETIT